MNDNADPAAKVVRLLTKYPTTRQMTVTIRDSLEDVTMREFVLHESTRQLERLLFAKGSEPEHLVAAINEQSQYLTAAK